MTGRRLAGRGRGRSRSRSPHNAAHVTIPAMFSKSARWYDRFYGDKDYAAEGRRVADLIRLRCPDATTLLDVACGTGRHLEHLRATFTCEGIDIDPRLLDIARSRLAGVPLALADMVQFSLGRRFDAVTCLFSSIGYVETLPRLRSAVASMAAHLNPGGVLVVEPWVLADDWLEGNIVAETADDGSEKLVRVIAGYRDGAVSVLPIHYVHARPGRIDTADERHVLGLFGRDDYLDAFTAAGLAPEWDSEGLIGRGLILAVAPAGA